MRTKLLVVVLAACSQLSCGGEASAPSDAVEAAPPDLLGASSWPDAADLGVVVSSEIVATDDRPPAPDFER